MYCRTEAVLVYRLVPYDCLVVGKSDIVAEMWFILHYCFSSLFIPPGMYLLPYDHYHTFLLLETTKISSETAGTISNKADSKDEDLAFVAGATGRVGSRTVRLKLTGSFT